MDQQSLGLSFRDVGIASILAQRHLSVPLNQRSYAWETSYVQTLFCLNPLSRPHEGHR
jgi:hypothetical protein